MRSRSPHHPMPPPRKHSGAARRSRSPHHPMPSPSKHPGAARRSGSPHRNARKLSPIYATGNMERVGGKNTKDCELQGKALDEEQKRNKKESADALDPENTPCSVLTDRRCHTPAAAQPQSYICSRQATTTQAEVAIGAATLAPSQAGAISSQRVSTYSARFLIWLGPSRISLTFA